MIITAPKVYALTSEGRINLLNNDTDLTFADGYYVNGVYTIPLGCLKP